MRGRRIYVITLKVLEDLLTAKGRGCTSDAPDDLEVMLVFQDDGDAKNCTVQLVVASSDWEPVAEGCHLPQQTITFTHEAVDALPA